MGFLRFQADRADGEILKDIHTHTHARFLKRKGWHEKPKSTTYSQQKSGKEANS